jgi:hypothetical protein
MDRYHDGRRPVAATRQPEEHRHLFTVEGRVAVELRFHELVQWQV